MRQNIYLRHRKASSPVSNALGSLIFLGTPFFVKRWGSGQKILFFFSILWESLIAGGALLDPVKLTVEGASRCR